ncbi:hypothetical protein JT200_06240 [Helicobacter pylori]|nr:hypothetical protein [Helicobacter pylori]
MGNYISDAEVKLLLYERQKQLHSIKCLDIGTRERLELLENITALELAKRRKDD